MPSAQQAFLGGPSPALMETWPPAQPTPPPRGLFPFLSDQMALFQGLENEYQEEGQPLGRFTYDQEGESLQMFAAPVRTSCFLHTPGSLATVPASGPTDT